KRGDPTTDGQLQPILQRVRRRAGQAPFQTRGSVVKLDLAADRALHHRVDDRGAKAPMVRLSHGRADMFSPSHYEGVKSTCQPTSTRPASVESAPYLPAWWQATSRPMLIRRSDRPRSPWTPLCGGCLRC